MKKTQEPRGLINLDLIEHRLDSLLKRYKKYKKKKKKKRPMIKPRNTLVE
jgi:hypothetical protein